MCISFEFLCVSKGAHGVSIKFSACPGKNDVELYKEPNNHWPKILYSYNANQSQALTFMLVLEYLN